jgi:4-cresol dehydrogenase (hydroxylating) flavoprotein subunit
LTDTTLVGSHEALAEALEDLRAALGEGAVLTGTDIEEFIDPYEPVSWGGQRNAAVVQPSTTEEVQAVVRIANRHEVPIWVGSQGRNNGYGGAGTIVPNSIIVNLRKMDRVLEVNDELGYVVVEPGVSYNSLYAHVKETGKKVFIDVPDLGWGSVIGNACDHGYGYTKYGDHASSVCGIEVVLPDGEILRTGMGGLGSGDSWHVYKKGYGPDPEQIFMQSNFGIITRMGLWCMPTPDVYFNGVIRIESDEDLPGVIDAIRPLMVDGTIPNIPSCFNAAGILTMLGKRKDFWDGKGPIPAEVIQEVREKTGLGAWMMRFALYGRRGQVDEALAHVQAVFADVPGATVMGTAHDAHNLDEAELDQNGHVQAGIPDMSMLSAVQFVGDDGGHVGFSSVIPLTGGDTRAIMDLVKESAAAASLDYTATFMINPRSAVHVYLAFYDRSDDEHARHVYQMCRETVVKAAEAGYGEYRAHTSAMDVVANAFSWNDNAQRRFNERLKDALDPKGILMPGRSGIWPAKYRGTDLDHPWES